MLNMIKVAINTAFEYYYSVKPDIKQIAIVPKNSVKFQKSELDNLDNLNITKIDISNPNYEDKITIGKLASIKEFLSDTSTPNYHYYTVSGLFIIIKENYLKEDTLDADMYSKYLFTLNFLTVDLDGGEVFIDVIYDDNINRGSIIPLPL